MFCGTFVFTADRRWSTSRTVPANPSTATVVRITHRIPLIATRFLSTCATAASITSRGWSVSSHSGIPVTVRFPAVVGESEKETDSSNDLGMIDDFRLWGSRTWRRKGGPFTQEGGPPEWPTFSTTTTPLSQRAEPSPLWLRILPKRRIRRGTTRISRVRCGKAKRDCASRVPAGRLLSRLSMDNEGDGSAASLPRPVRACGGLRSRKMLECG